MMAKNVTYFREIMSLAVLLMMALALAAGEADSTGEARSAASQGLSSIALAVRFQQNFEHELGQRALSISIRVATDLSPFRGEDE